MTNGYFVLVTTEGLYFTGSNVRSANIADAFRFSSLRGALANARGSETPFFVAI